MIIIESSIFTQRITELMSDDDYRSLQEALTAAQKKRLKQIGLSQVRFAALIGVSKRTLENWEQGRRHPTGPARALLRIVKSDPKHALRALHG